MGLELDEISEMHSKSKEPILARYVRRHHAPNQIIRDKSDGTITWSKFKGTYLLAEFEPINVKDALYNEICLEAMNEEMEQIEKNKTWSHVPRLKDKNLIGTKWVFIIS